MGGWCIVNRQQRCVSGWNDGRGDKALFHVVVRHRHLTVGINGQHLLIMGSISYLVAEETVKFRLGRIAIKVSGFTSATHFKGASNGALRMNPVGSVVEVSHMGVGISAVPRCLVDIWPVRMVCEGVI